MLLIEAFSDVSQKRRRAGRCCEASLNGSRQIRCNCRIRLDRGRKTCDGWIVEVFSTRKGAITDFRGTRDALLLGARTTGVVLGGVLFMLHITCDLCGQELQAGQDHYVVKIEIFAQHDPTQLIEADLEEDHMEAVSQLLRELDDEEIAQAVQPSRNHLRYDLCPECRQRFLDNPLHKDLTKDAAQKFDFSEN